MVILRTFILICFLLFISIGCANSSTEDSNSLEPEESYDLTPPPSNALHLRRAKDIDKVTIVTPTNWPVRAIYVGWRGLYEFDKQGNILRFDNKDTEGNLVEYYLNNKPAWTGEQEVYYWRHNPKSEVYYDVDVVVEAFVKTKDNIVCPARAVAQDYTSIKLAYEDDSQWMMFLNHECSNAAKTEINGREFLVYPNEVRYASDNGFSMYWAIQYFDDPITPMYDQNNNCVLYCDVNEAKK